MGDFSLSGGVEVTGFISPTDTTDTFPVIDTLYGIDGLRNVDNLTQLNAIPNQRRRSGMLVGVSGGTEYYKLGSSPWSGTSVDWSIFTAGGGSGQFGTTYFVTPGGDNSTGEYGNISKPFKTITGARNTLLTDALTGSTLIYVYPGTYDDEEIQYDNGNMYLSPGVLIKPPVRFHSLDISGVNTGAKTFTVNGNWATYINVDSQFQMVGSTGNDGIYTVFGVTDVLGTTEIVTVESIPDATVDGYITSNRHIIPLGIAPTYASLSSSATTFNLFGEGEIYIDKTIDNDWSYGFISANNDSVIYCEIDKATMVQGNICGVGGTSDVIFKGNVLSIIEDGYAISPRGSSNSVFDFQKIIGSGDTWVYRILNFNGTTVLNTDVLQNYGGGGLYDSPISISYMTGGIFIINCPQIIAGDNARYGVVTTFNSGGRVEINGNIIAGTGVQGISINQDTGCETIINGNITTYDSYAYNNDNIVGGSNTISKTYINGDIIVTGGTSNAIRHQKQTLRLNGSITNKDISGTGTTYNGITIDSSTGNLIIDNLKIKSDNESITASAPRTVNIENTLYIDKPLNSNITTNGLYNFTGTTNVGDLIVRDNIQSTTSSATGTTSFAFGNQVKAHGNYSHAEGHGTIAIGQGDHAEGRETKAMGGNSHAEGGETIASGDASHAEGQQTQATREGSHAEGIRTTASGYGSHSEGGDTTASNYFSHAEGSGTNASGENSHAEGSSTTASGKYSHAEGRRTIASGANSHSGGRGLDAVSNKIIASGETSFVHFRQTSASGIIGAYGDHSAILGGNDHNIGTGSTSSGIFAGSGNTISDDILRSVILGGSNITGTTDDTVYVPNLDLCEFGGTLYTSSISGCSPITIGEANFPQGITVSGESVSTENQTEIFSTQLIDREMDSGTTRTVQSFVANYKHPSGSIQTSQTFFRPSDVISRETIIYGTPGVVHADYGTIDVTILGLGPTETIELTGTTTGTTTVSFGWNGVSFSGTITVNTSGPPP